MELEYIWQLPQPYLAKEAVTIKGVVPHGENRFDFQTGNSKEKDDVIFHMSNRYTDNQIVVYRRELDSRLPEEKTYGKRHFIAGTNFKVRIVYDGRQFKNFEYTWQLPRTFQVNDVITIKGVLPHRGKGFLINFQTESSREEGDVIFHMSNWYADNQIVLSTRELGSGWQEEKTFRNRCPIAGSSFEIRVVSDGKRFKIAIDKQPFAEYGIRISNKSIRFMYIYGDAQITSISFER